MCSILVFAKSDNINPDPALQWQKFGRGDVIDIRDDDNFFWGNDIQGPKALGWWRVVVLPNVASATVSGLLSSEILAYQALPSAPRKLRINKLNLDALEATETIVKGVPLLPTDVVRSTQISAMATVTMKLATAPSGLDIPLI